MSKQCLRGLTPEGEVGAVVNKLIVWYFFPSDIFDFAKVVLFYKHTLRE